MKKFLLTPLGMLAASFGVVIVCLLSGFIFGWSHLGPASEPVLIVMAFGYIGMALSVLALFVQFLNRLASMGGRK